MTMFIIQSAILIAVAYLLGCIIGWLLRHFFGVSKTVRVKSEETIAPSTPATAAKPEPIETVVPAKPEPKVASKTKPVKAKQAPKPKTAKAPKPAAKAQKDDLKRIRGIGPQNETRLNSIGVTSFAQIAAWSKEEQRETGERLSFPGRIEREEWVKQAKVLASGGETEFAKRVDNGEVESSTGTPEPAAIGKKPAVLAAAPDGEGDDLTQIGGVGNALEKKLNAIGIYTFEQVSKWTADEQAWIGNELGFQGRPERENWSAEAKALAEGLVKQTALKSTRGAITAKKKK
ncbi:MAG: hypothetical protein AAGA76_14215 [Pseudomonadota bacterium]